MLAREIPISLSLSNNGSQMPGSGYFGVFSKTVHPGITLGSSYTYRLKEKSAVFQTAKLGYFYHRFAQHAVQLYTELGYRHYVYKPFYVEALLGGGYLHSFPDVQQFEWRNGKYVRLSNLGRSQAMVAISGVAGYDIGRITKTPLKLFLQYQFAVQTPFVNKYVPLLPNAAFHIGAVYTFQNKAKANMSE